MAVKKLMFGSGIMIFFLHLYICYIVIGIHSKSLELYEKLQDLRPHLPTEEDGVLWPARAKVHDVRETEKAYRDMQGNEIWQFFNTFTISVDHPEVCVLSPTLWLPGQNTTTIPYMMTRDLKRCNEDPRKTIFISPITLRSSVKDKGDTAHANIAIFNKTQSTLELFDPNGLTAYDENMKGSYHLKSLTSILGTVAKNSGYGRLAQTGVPVQLIEMFDRTLQINGFCESWVFWYTRVRLLNSHLTQDDLEVKILRYVKRHGVRGILEFIQANLERAESILSYSPTEKTLALQSLPKDNALIMFFKLFKNIREELKNVQNYTIPSTGEKELMTKEYARYWKNVGRKARRGDVDWFDDISDYYGSTQETKKYLTYHGGSKRTRWISL